VPALLLMALIVFGAIKILPFFKKTSPPSDTANGGTEQGSEESANTEPQEISIRIRCAGDIMVHAGADDNQLESAYQPDGSYDFSPTFTYVSKWLEDADLSMAQFEMTFNDSGYYSGYPLFVTPPAMAEAVKDAGVDVALFASNHMLDAGLNGAKYTVGKLKDIGFTAVAGAREKTSDNRSHVVDVKGLKIGIVSFAYETQRVDGMRTMNGMFMAEDAPDYINSFRYEYGDDWQYHINEDDLALIKSEMDWCRTQGADILICYFHWGTEYQFEPDNADRELAQFAVDNGADIIFASHPHVCQPVEIIDGVPVYFALGNFVSNQRYETLTGWYGYPELISRRTELGLIGNVELTYDKTSGKLTYNNISAIPTWVEKFYNGSRWVHQIIPLLDDLDTNETLQITGNAWRAKNSLADMTEFLGERFIYGATAQTPTGKVTEEDKRFYDTDSYLIVANKKHPLPEGYVPSDLVYPEVPMRYNNWQLRKVAAEALEKMFAAASLEGLTLVCGSGYRDPVFQATLYNGYVESSGKEAADTFSARPGYSDHQTGLATDICSLDEAYDLSQSFEETAEGKWLKDHAHEYGFIMRYPKGKDDITGYYYEPWHFRYIGVDEATAIYNVDPFYTFEEYYGIEGGGYID